MADQKTTKYNRHGHARIIEDVTDANNARFNGFVFDEAPSQSDEVPAPAGNASRDAWVEYALAHGATDVEVADPAEGGLTRDDLRGRFGD